MKVVVVGLGVQGEKRKFWAGSDLAATIDPYKSADYKNITDVPLHIFDAALVCVPDQQKETTIKYLLNNKKHVLVEKAISSKPEQVKEIASISNKNKVVCYVAYNHRFEPNFVELKNILASGELGSIYRIRMFYGNGTAKLVKNSPWRDQGLGVLSDLGPHLLDTLLYWFKTYRTDFDCVSLNCFENKSFDHVVLSSKNNNPSIELEMSLISWRNHFACDIFAENGSVHLNSLCKWGPATLIKRKRVFPSGRPVETAKTLVMADPTWELEYSHFKNLCKMREETDYKRDLWIANVLENFSQKQSICV